MKPLHGLLLSSAAGALATCMPAAAAERSDDPRPNIVLVVADDLGYGNLGSYGQALIQTPALDSLAAEGLRFTRFYSGASLCLPSRGCLMTGLHMGHSRIRENGGGGIHEPLQEEDTTLSTVLRTAGYHTAMIGKWSLGDAFRGNTDPAMDSDGPGALYKHGWDVYLGEPNQTLNHDYYPDHIYRYDPGGFLGAATPVNQLVPVPMADDPATTAFDESYTTDRYMKEALAYIDAAKDHPFFLYLPLQTPHKDFVVPALEPYTSGQPWTTSEKRFASMISRMDRMIGDLVARLESHAIAGDTLLVFTSDNGGLVDFDSRFDNNGPLDGYKGDASEGGLRVPCIAWWPGRIAPGRLSGELLYSPDFLPTFAALAGIEAPSPTDGISFVPTLLDTGEQPTHDYLFFLAGTDGVDPALQDYHVVRSAAETRSDETIRAAAFSETVTVPEFSRRRTTTVPAVLYPPAGPVPAPEASFLDAGGGTLGLAIDVPDGIAYSVAVSTDLGTWGTEADFLRMIRMENATQDTCRAYFEALNPADQRLFARLSYTAFAAPQPVAENPVPVILLQTSFTAHEPAGAPGNDSAPLWQTHPAIADPGTVSVVQTSGPVPPVFFPGFPDELAVDLNVTTESPWQLDIPVVASAPFSINAVSFTARHYTNDGVLKDLLDNSFYTVAILDNGLSEMESHTIAAAVSGNNYTVPFGTLGSLPAGSYTLRIRADANGDGRGNNQGIDNLVLRGAGPGPAVVLQAIERD